MLSKLSKEKSNIEMDFLFQVNAGMINGITQERKYGANYDVDPGTSPELVRDGGGYVVDYPYLSSNAEMYIVSSSTSDTMLMHVIGLKDNNGLWEPYSVYVTLNGTTPVSIGQFIRVFRIRNQSISSNVGEIRISTVSVGIPTQSQTQAMMSIGKGSTLMAMYTVPSGYTAFIYRLYYGSGRSEDASFSYEIRPFGKVFHTIGEVSGFESSSQLELGYEPIKEKTDIIVTASTLTNNTIVRASFHFLLVDNRYL